MDKSTFTIRDFNNALHVFDLRGKRLVFKDRYADGFIVTFCGRIRFSCEQGSLIADREHSVFLPRGLSYVNECEEDAESLVFNFYAEGTSQLPQSLTPVHEFFAINCFDTIEKATRLRDGGRLLILSEMYSLADRLLAAPSNMSATQEIPTIALAYMAEHYAEPSLTVKHIADACYVSEVYLRKLFVRYRGVTPFKALQELRMERARVLAKEKRPVGEIAAAVGYSDIYQFSRAYRKFFGYPPSET